MPCPSRAPIAWRRGSVVSGSFPRSVATTIRQVVAPEQPSNPGVRDHDLHDERGLGAQTDGLDQLDVRQAGGDGAVCHALLHVCDDRTSHAGRIFAGGNAYRERRHGLGEAVDDGELVHDALGCPHVGVEAVREQSHRVRGERRDAQPSRRRTLEEVDASEGRRIGGELRGQHDLVGASDVGPEPLSAGRGHPHQLCRVDRERRGAGVRQHDVVLLFQREDVIGDENAAARDDVRCDGGLAGARPRDEAEGSTVPSHCARMQQLEALERRGKRQHLREEQSLPTPQGVDRARREDPRPVRRDEMASVVWGVDAVAEVGVVVDRHDESSVASSALEHPLSPSRAPGIVELGGCCRSSSTTSRPPAPAPQADAISCIGAVTAIPNAQPRSDIAARPWRSAGSATVIGRSR